MPEIKVQLTSKLTKKFLEQNKSLLRDYLVGELNVMINSHNTGADFIKIISEDPILIEKAELFMLAFDSRIGAFVKNNSIKNKDEILDRHLNVARVEADDLLRLIRAGNINEIKKEINIPPAVNSNEPTLTDAFIDAKQNAPASEIPYVPTKPEKKTVANSTNVPAQSKVKTRNISKVEFDPRNQNSAIAMMALLAPETSIIFMVGPAGTAKTFTPIHAAVTLYNEGKIDGLEAIKPRTATGKGDIGALKGGLEEKMAPYTHAAIGSNFFKVTGKTLGSQSTWAQSRTPDFDRGESKENRLVLIDEAQNLTVEQAKLLITRISDPDERKYTKFVFTGDISGNQADLRNELPGLTYLLTHLGDHVLFNKDSQLRSATAFIQFTEEDSVARSKLLPEILHGLDSPSERVSKLMQAYRETTPNSARQKSIDALSALGHEILTEVAGETKKRYEKSARAAYPHVFNKGLRVEGNIEGMSVKIA